MIKQVIVSACLLPLAMAISAIEPVAAARGKTLDTTTGSKVRVGDIVTNCDGEPCELEIGPAPLPGHSRVVYRKDVVRVLKAAGFGSSKLKIPVRKRIFRPANIVSEEELRQAIEAAIEDIMPKNVSLEALGRVGEYKVPASGYGVRVRWPGAPVFRRRVSLPVDLVADGASFRTLQVGATFNYKARLPVAARDLPFGTILDQTAVKWAEVQLDTAPSEFAGTIGDVIGRRLNQTTEVGAPFKTRDLDRVPVVHRGDRLVIESLQGLVRIRTLGLAKQDGAVGDRIRIGVPSTSRLVWAVVTGPDSAEVVP
ncbi:MAG: flagellar basal body P-ring formation chaperone FlgA [Myxococcota bacterium]|nr:flagellar basal body P-ring formation chaperone FlgA [Myxococcota bacterium]